MIFIDTNYFLRFLLKDNLPQHQTAKQLILDGASGKIKLFTSIIVIFEIYWVLSAYYGQNKKEQINTLDKILDLEFIVLEERQILRSTLELYRQTTVEFEDCYNLSFAKANKAKGFKTFDLKLVKITNLR